jgi:riboflavin kinase / FMN adenylyltransferase
MQAHSLNSNFRAVNAVVTIGTFDGVHHGHRAVLALLKERAAATGGESVVITFYPHPRQVLSDGTLQQALLSTREEKRALLEKEKVDHLIVIDFDREFSEMGACEFVGKILVGRIGARHLIVGFNHHFGRNGEGNFDTIQACAGQFGINVEKVGAIDTPEGTVSSSMIRTALEEGRLDDANRMLGYNYSLTGTVVEGKKLGRKIGFPTANIDTGAEGKLIPANGVYAVGVSIGSESFNGVMNIGTNPTVNASRGSRTVEVNIIDFDRDIYGRVITVELRHRLRSEIKFNGLDELSAQIAADKSKAIELLG